MAVDWVKAVSEAGDAELKQVDGRIAAIETELEALKALRKVFQARLGIRQERKPAVPRQPRPESAPPPKGVTTAKYREDAAVYLLAAGTPQKPSVLAGQCGIPTGSVSAVFDHPWFERRPEGLVLTPAGRRAAG